jgi:hypothetical protein
LKIDQWSVDAAGNLRVDFLKKDYVDLKQYGRDEQFLFGFTLYSNGTSTRIADYNHRLICKNGMRAYSGYRGQTNFERAFKYHKTDKSFLDYEALNTELLTKHQHQYMPTWFEGRLETSTKTKASLAELEACVDLVNRHVDEADPDLKKQWQSTLEMNHFWGVHATHDRIAKSKGAEFLSGLSQSEKALIKTPMSVWEMVNELTYLGSNRKKSVVPIKESFEIFGQSAGAQALQKKEYNLEKKGRTLELLSL